MFVDIEINIFMSFIFALFLFPFLHSNIFNFRHYVIAGKTYRHVPFIEKNVTHSYLHRKLAYFICYCFLYALRNTGASVLRVIRKNLPSLKARIQTLSKLPPAFSPFRGSTRCR